MARNFLWGVSFDPQDSSELNPDFARKLLSWRQSGFSIQSGTHIYDQEARQALSQYIVRPPLSLEKIRWDEDRDTVSWKWPQWDHVVRHAPQGWKELHGTEDKSSSPQSPTCTVPESACRSAWARLIAKSTRSTSQAAAVCAANGESPLVVCPRCSSKMRVLAVITNCCRSEKDPAPPDQDRLPSSGLGSRAAETAFFLHRPLDLLDRH